MKLYCLNYKTLECDMICQGQNPVCPQALKFYDDKIEWKNRKEFLSILNKNIKDYNKNYKLVKKYMKTKEFKEDVKKLKKQLEWD